MVTLVIGTQEDPHLGRVIKHLDEMEVEHLTLDPSSLRMVGVSLFLNGDKTSGEIRLKTGRRVRIAEVSSIWSNIEVAWQNISLRRFSAERKDLGSMISEREWFWFFTNLFYLTKSKLWINPPSADWQANSKLYQLHTASRLGLNIPDSLVTNDSRALNHFGSAYDAIALKTLDHGIRYFMPDGYLALTRKLKRRELNRQMKRFVSYAPSFFQEYVEKLTELRVYVVKDRVYASEILSQESDDMKEDWRRYPQKKVGREYVLDTTRWRCHATSLPPTLEGKLVELVKQLGLYFAGLDLIKRTDGKFFFLEANPLPAFAWIEDITHQPISLAIAEALASSEAQPD
jgi:glutathione synthase/RimK-type ligase-like ATP-grasp enzyme